MKTTTLLCFMSCLAMAAQLSAESAKRAAAPNGTTSDAAPSGSPDPNAWTTRTYRLPADDLIHAFVTKERGQLHAPPMPKADAGAADIEKFLKQSDDIVRAYLSSEAVIPLPKGSLAAFDPVNKTLAVRTTNATHDLISVFSKGLVDRVPNYLSFNLHLTEADASTVRGMVKEACTQAEHRAVWERMQGLIDQGKARELELLRLDARSGQRVSLKRGEEHTYGTSFYLSELGWCNMDQTMRPVGTELELDPVLASNGRTVDFSLSLTHHYAPPTNRWPLVAQNTVQKLESLVTDFHQAELKTSVRAISGMTKMVGVWKPEGAPEAERAGNLQAAFLTADVNPMLPPQNDRVLDLLKAQGEKVLPTPPPGKTPPEVLPSGMVLRRFRVPRDFLTATPDSRQMESALKAPADSFSVPRNEPRAMRSVTALDVLQMANIPFPEGSSANYNPALNELIVRNLPANQEKVAAYLQAIAEKVPNFLSCTLHVVQADAKTLRAIAEQTRRITDQSAAWQSVEDAAAQGRAKILSTFWLETNSGQRTTVTAGTEYTVVRPPNDASSSRPAPAPASTPPAGDSKNANNNNGSGNGNANIPPPAQPPLQPAPAPASTPTALPALNAESVTRLVGNSWQVDPVISSDDESADVSFALEYHYAPPTFQYDTTPGGEKVLRANAAATQMHVAHVVGVVTLATGTTRLLGIWKPEGSPEFEKGDVLQAAFLRVDVVPLEK